MNVNEFGQAASSSLLNCEEIAEVFLHLTVKPRPYCRYPSGFRCFSRSKHTVTRFSALSSKRCSKRENKICFTASRDLLISGLGIYGIAPVEIQLASVVDPCTYGSSVCHSATNNVVLTGLMGDSTLVWPTLRSQSSAQPTPPMLLLSALLAKQSYRNAYGNDDGGKAEGQIPSLHFLVPWPQNQKMQ
uniref:Uncharacterized protein n=1 Tax=Ditylenchus dipsaci TaxID=166011 RepID=A0A915DWW4_9BILA